jgi:hypothetical protein
MTNPTASGITPTSTTTAAFRYPRASERARTAFWPSIAAALALFTGMSARADQTVTLGWNPVTNRAVAGYALYQGYTSGVYTSRYDAGTNTSTTVTGLKEGDTSYFAAMDYNAALQESPPSGEVAYIVPGVVRVTPPSQPGKLTTLSFPVAAGHWYEIQASTNLQTWTNLWQTAVSTSNAWVSYQDPQESSFPRRFYRLILN